MKPAPAHDNTLLTQECRLMLDLIATASARFKHEGQKGIEWTWALMNDREKLAFDLWLVKMGDELSFRAGPPEHRFVLRVLRMAALAGFFDRPCPHGCQTPGIHDHRDQGDNSQWFTEAVRA